MPWLPLEAARSYARTSQKTEYVHIPPTLESTTLSGIGYELQLTLNV